MVSYYCYQLPIKHTHTHTHLLFTGPAPPDLLRVRWRSHLSWWELCCSWEACGGTLVGPSERRCSVSSRCTGSLWDDRREGNDLTATLESRPSHACLRRKHRAAIAGTQLYCHLMLSLRNPTERSGIPIGETYFRLLIFTQTSTKPTTSTSLL